MKPSAAHQGRGNGPAAASRSLRFAGMFERLEMLYWLHLSRRDFVRQNPANDGLAFGTFASRSPVRPNLIGISIATLIGIEGTTVLVRGLDCLDGTPPFDLKPDRTLFTPIAPATTGRL